jgi:hypothetical protein
VEFRDRGAGAADIQWESLIDADEHRLTASNSGQQTTMAGFPAS